MSLFQSYFQRIHYTSGKSLGNFSDPHIYLISFLDFLSHKIKQKVPRQFIPLLKTELTLLLIQSPPLFIPSDLKVGLTSAAPGVCCESLERSLATISH